MSSDTEILEIAIRKLSEAMDEFITECADENGSPKAPSRKALMKIKACLPPYCVNALSRRNN